MVWWSSVSLTFYLMSGVHGFDHTVGIVSHSGWRLSNYDDRQVLLQESWLEFVDGDTILPPLAGDFAALTGHTCLHSVYIFDVLVGAVPDEFLSDRLHHCLFQWVGQALH